MLDNKNIGYALKEDKGIKINFRGTKITLKVSGSNSEGKYSLIEMEHPPNTGPALHIFIQMHLKPMMFLTTAIL